MIRPSLNPRPAPVWIDTHHNVSVDRRERSISHAVDLEVYADASIARVLDRRVETLPTLATPSFAGSIFNKHSYVFERVGYTPGYARVIHFGMKNRNRSIPINLAVDSCYMTQAGSGKAGHIFVFGFQIM